MEVDQPEELTNLQQLYEEIREAINAEFLDDLDSYFSDRLKTGAWAFDPKLKEMPPEQIDRCGEVLYGPVFSCKEYEWPEHNGFPMSPIIQLDLEKCSQLGGIDLGSGLLQLWIGHRQHLEDALIRVIPLEFVNEANLTSIPTFDPEITTSVPVDWALEEDDRIYDMPMPRQITGYKPKRFTSQLGHGIKDELTIKDLTSDKMILDKIKDFDKIIKTIEKKWSPSNCHLFGTFYPIQYEASWRDTPLFCFDDDYGLEWGDPGNAQLFFKRNEKGELGFSFSWSTS